MGVSFASNEYLNVSHCGIEYLWDRDYYQLREKGRDDYHILYIVQGKCHAEVCGKKYVLNEGGVVLFLPFEKQLYTFYMKDKPISCFIHFSGTGCDKILKKIGLTEKRVVNIGKSEAVKAIFEKITHECDLQNVFYEDIAASYLYELLMIIGRREKYGKNRIYLRNKQIINKASQSMYDNYAKNYPIKYYADLCHLSVSRFTHIFKECMEVTPVEYINKIRINKASFLINNTEFTMTEIAEKVGFSNQNYFGRIFKKYMGVSPKRYLKQ